VFYGFYVIAALSNRLGSLIFAHFARILCVLCVKNNTLARKVRRTFTQRTQRLSSYGIKIKTFKGENFHSKNSFIIHRSSFIIHHSSFIVKKLMLFL